MLTRPPVKRFPIPFRAQRGGKPSDAAWVRAVCSTVKVAEIEGVHPERLDAALAGSHLAGVPAAVLSEGLGRSRVRRIAAGTAAHRERDSDAHCELVVTGLLRVLVTAPDGRTMTVRYCRPGSLVGVATLFAPGFIMPATVEALEDAELLVLSPDAVRWAVRRHPPLAQAFLVELSERTLTFVAEIGGGAFAPVRQRVARHLLDLAVPTQAGQRLVARVGQQALAEMVGSVREVVVRVLRELREEGMVTTERGRVIVLDPARLIDEAISGGAVGSYPEWNPGH